MIQHQHQKTSQWVLTPVQFNLVDSSSDELDYEVEPEPVEVKCEDGAVISRIAILGGEWRK